MINLLKIQLLRINCNFSNYQQFYEMLFPKTDPHNALRSTRTIFPLHYTKVAKKNDHQHHISQNRSFIIQSYESRGDAPPVNSNDKARLITIANVESCMNVFASHPAFTNESRLRNVWLASNNKRGSRKTIRRADYQEQPESGIVHSGM